MSNEITQYNPGGPMTVADVKAQVNLIQHVMKEVMKEGDHFGTIPGCGPKPTLLKPGAEKIAMTFRFAVDPQIEVLDLPNYHREYRVRVGITNQAGEFLGAGVGCCSTLEGKFRFRTGPTQITGEAVPKKYWDLKKTNPAESQKVIGGQGFSTKKGDDGVWYICIQGEKCEHDNPADYWNTILKMAKKRALVDAILTVTAASDIFTQDIEDDPSLYAKTVNVTKTDPDPVPEAKPVPPGTKEDDFPDPNLKKKDPPAKKEKPKPDPKPDPIPEPEPEPEPTEDIIRAFWVAFERLAAETGDDRDDVIRQLTKGQIDPLAVNESPIKYIMAATKRAEDLYKRILGGD